MLDPAFSRGLPAVPRPRPRHQLRLHDRPVHRGLAGQREQGARPPGQRRHHPDLGQPGGPRLDGLDLDAQAARGRRQRAGRAVRRDPGRLRRRWTSGPTWRAPSAGRRRGARAGPPRRRRRWTTTATSPTRSPRSTALLRRARRRPPRRRSVASTEAPRRWRGSAAGSPPGWSTSPTTRGAGRRRLVGRRGRLRGRVDLRPVRRRPRRAAAGRAPWRGVPASGAWTSSLDRDGVRRRRSRRSATRSPPATSTRSTSAGCCPRRCPPGADVRRRWPALLAAGNPAPYAGSSGCPAHGVRRRHRVARAVPAPRRRPGRVRPDQGHRRATAAGPHRQGPRRERDDRRPGPQRPRRGVR